MGHFYGKLEKGALIWKLTRNSGILRSTRMFCDREKFSSKQLFSWSRSSESTAVVILEKVRLTRKRKAAIIAKSGELISHMTNKNFLTATAKTAIFSMLSGLKSVRFLECSEASVFWNLKLLDYFWTVFNPSEDH